MNFLKRNWKLVLVLWIVGLAVWGIPRLRDQWQLEHRQVELLRGIADRNARTYSALVSPTYADEWKFTSTMIQRAMDDVAAQFLTMKIEPINPVWKIGDKEATCELTLKMTGKPATPMGDLILSKAEELKTPIKFTWRKEGFGAWTWKLVAVSIPDMEVPEGYTPGMLSGREE